MTLRWREKRWRTAVRLVSSVAKFVIAAMPVLGRIRIEF